MKTTKSDQYHSALHSHQLFYRLKGIAIGFNNSPLEYLTAFAIVFAAGVLSTLALGKYVQTLKNDSERSV